MKKIAFITILTVLATVGCAQSSNAGNGVMNTTTSPVLFCNTNAQVNATDCAGEWVSNDGSHLMLYSNSKAVWKDDGHVYYMAWHSENSADDNRIKITLSGNPYCKHTSFYLSLTGNGAEVIEDAGNQHTHFSKDITAAVE